MEKTEEHGRIESKVDTKVILTFSTGEKIRIVLPRKATNVILDQINDSFYDDVRSIMLLSNETAGIQCG